MGQWLAPLFFLFLPSLVQADADAGKPFPIAGEQPVWLTDYAEARELGRASGKPLLVVFRCQH